MADCPIIFVLDSNDNSRDIIKSYLSEYVQDDKIKAFSDYNKAVEVATQAADLYEQETDFIYNVAFLNMLYNENAK